MAGGTLRILSGPFAATIATVTSVSPAERVQLLHSYKLAAKFAV